MCWQNPFRPTLKRGFLVSVSLKELKALTRLHALSQKTLLTFTLAPSGRVITHTDGMASGGACQAPAAFAIDGLRESVSVSATLLKDVLSLFAAKDEIDVGLVNGHMVFQANGQKAEVVAVEGNTFAPPARKGAVTTAIVQAADLRRAASFMATVASDKAASPAHSAILISTPTDSTPTDDLTLWAIDRNPLRAAKVELPCESSGPIDTLVPATELAAVLSLFQSEEVKLIDSDDQLELQGGDLYAHITTIIGDFPIPALPSLFEHTVAVTSAELVRTARAAKKIGVEDDRDVIVAVNENGLRLGTGSFERSLDAQVSLGDSRAFRIKLPASALLALAKFGDTLLLHVNDDGCEVMLTNERGDKYWVTPMFVA
jgi:hypothetical protein